MNTRDRDRDKDKSSSPPQWNSPTMKPMSWARTQNWGLQSRHGSQGQFHGIPRPFIWKISPVEGVLKWEIRLHDKSHVEEMKSFPVAFLLAQNWTGAAITPTPKGHILLVRPCNGSKNTIWEFSWPGETPTQEMNGVTVIMTPCFGSSSLSRGTTGGNQSNFGLVILHSWLNESFCFTPAPGEGWLSFPTCWENPKFYPCTRGRKKDVSLTDTRLTHAPGERRGSQFTTTLYRGNGSWCFRFGNGGNGLSSLSILFLSLLLYSYLRRYVTSP